MATDFNKGRAQELLNSLNGTRAIDAWLILIAQILAFLLNRYINED